MILDSLFPLGYAPIVGMPTPAGWTMAQRKAFAGKVFVSWMPPMRDKDSELFITPGFVVVIEQNGSVVIPEAQPTGFNTQKLLAAFEKHRQAGKLYPDLKSRYAQALLAAWASQDPEAQAKWDLLKQYASQEGIQGLLQANAPLVGGIVDQVGQQVSTVLIDELKRRLLP